LVLRPFEMVAIMARTEKGSCAFGGNGTFGAGAGRPPKIGADGMSRIRSCIAPAYLFACLILGGSDQGPWLNMVLQLAGVAMIAFLAIKPSSAKLTGPAKALLGIALASIGVVIVQLIPLPPALWAHGVRSRLAADFTLLTPVVPWLPWSLTPYASLDALFKLIPPLALYCWIIRQREYQPALLAGALLAGTIAGILIGVLQVGGGDHSPWYLYPETNIGFAVGFFANANHFADLLVISLPFVAALAAHSRRQDDGQRSHGWILLLCALSLLILAGIGLNRSLAAYGLSVPVAAASALIVVPARSAWRRVAITVAALSILFSVAALEASAIGAAKVRKDAATSVESREDILATTGKAIVDFMPAGSGLGSFVTVYPMYENRNKVTTEYVIHAHNDYAELALELGAPGILLILLFLTWWGKAAWDVWAGHQGGPFRRAASIASGAILLHSLVDYPLRTAAISGCFAMFLALLADRGRPAPKRPGDLRETRHVVIR
jgi:O-antigen ligase